MHLDDPASHLKLIEGLESRYKIEDCSFRTIYGTFQGYRIFASRKVAETIEKQTRYEAQLSMWMSGRISDTWRSTISFHAGNEMSPASLLTLKSH